jgi:hypothetical protein
MDFYSKRHQEQIEKYAICRERISGESEESVYVGLIIFISIWSLRKR